MDREEAIEQYRSLRDHPGAQARRRWDALRRSHTVHLRNTGEVRDVLEAFYTDTDLALEVLQNVRPSDVRDDFWDTLAQRFHNFLASSSTLIDHTRRFMKKYTGSEFERAYTERVAQVRDGGAADVVKGCRNLMLHVEQLPFVTRMRVDVAEGERTDIHLPAAKMLEMWDGWTAAAKEYLSGVESGELDLLEVVSSYDGLVESLYRWMYDQFELLHGDEIHDYNSRLRDLNLTLWGNAPGPQG